jgi:GNAT superfamily N-acetyltransferase
VATLPREPGAIHVEAADPESAEVAGLLASYLAEIEAAFGYDDSAAPPAPPENFHPPHGQFLVVRTGDGTAAGCGAVRLIDAATAEIKRMWLDPVLRGQGVSRRLLAALEAEAVALGATRAVLDTNAVLTTAIALYRSSGWQEIAAYNENWQATHWFAKDLAGTTPPFPPAI